MSDEHSNDRNQPINVLGRSVEVGFDTLFDLIILGLQPLFTTSICPISHRIGVFGPYIRNGRNYIQNVMKYVSSKGFGPITGKYYLQPYKQDFRKVRDLYPRVMRDLVTNLVPIHKWLHEFPRLISKSIVYLTIMRSQGNEVEGCSDYKIPMLGFILTDAITRERDVCNYLIDKETYTECSCPDPRLCLRTVKPFCPFYDSVEVPWAIKKLFLNKTDRIIATRNVEDLKTVIDEILV